MYKKTMKWASLIKDFKDRVGLSQSSPTPTSSTASSTEEPVPLPATVFWASSSRDKHELELEFNCFWEGFRSATSEKEKEASLSMAIDIFCKLLKQHTNAAHLVSMLVEAHVFSFAVGRAFVTDIEKLRISSKSRSLCYALILNFFTEINEDGICPGSNLLRAVEFLVSGAVDKQPLLDSGILCCLIHILNTFLSPDQGHKILPSKTEEPTFSECDSSNVAKQVSHLEVEGSMVHIMKALASHPLAAQSLIDDDSLQLLFQMVTTGSLTTFSQFKEGRVPLHTIQLYRHAMQILGLVLVNDNGSTAKYIRGHQLIKALLLAVKDFNPDTGDSAYTIGIVDLLQECVELSYKPEAGPVRLREDIHNAHGYQFLVQFALKLSTSDDPHSIPKSTSLECSSSNSLKEVSATSTEEFISEGDKSAPQISPSLSRLLDILVNLAQTGPLEFKSSAGQKNSKSKSGQNKNYVSSFGNVIDEVWEKGNTKIKDLEAIQMLQDIFLKANSTKLQAEVLNRMFKIFSSHIENYTLCQQLRTVPLFILNMSDFPMALQETILKILEYAVTVVNCVPEQELLSLCCLLQQPVTSSLKHTILSFFVKLISFDHQFKKVLREVGVLEVLLDDLKQHKLFSGGNQHNGSNDSHFLERKSSSSSFENYIDTKDTILPSPKIMVHISEKFPIFEDEVTISSAWDCLVSLLKKAEISQSSFRLSNGVTMILPFLSIDAHRAGVLRILSCLIIEDDTQAHPEELGALIEALKSEMVTSISGMQFKLHNDAKCDILAALWRILGSHSSAQRVFGDATGFSLILTTLHNLRNDESDNYSSPMIHMRIFSFLIRVITAGVCDNTINRSRLHTILISQSFYELLCDSGLLCVDCERQVAHLLLELALEILVSPSYGLQMENTVSPDVTEHGVHSLVLNTSDSIILGKERIYNAGAIGVLIRCLLLLTPKVQLEVLVIIEKLACASSFNKENLTSIGCVEFLLEIIHPFLVGSSRLLAYALQIIEVLGAFRLSSSELRILLRYILQVRNSSGNLLIEMMKRLSCMKSRGTEVVSYSPFVELDMSKNGHACLKVSLGKRSWPPASGYTFTCWFQFHNFFKKRPKDQDQASKLSSSNDSNSKNINRQILRIFSVGAIDDGGIFYTDLYLDNHGILTLATSDSCSLSFPNLELEEGKWHHLAVVHSKPNALAGLFQPSIAYVYLDGKLQQTGKLGYSPSPFGKLLQVTIGTPSSHAKNSDLSWRFRSCYLFDEVLLPGSICFMYILGSNYRGIFQDADLLHFIPNWACGSSITVLDSFDVQLSSVSSTWLESSKHGGSRLDGNGTIWDMEKLTSLSLQLVGKRLIFAFDGSSSEILRASGTASLLNLVDPMSSVASSMGGIPRFGRFLGDIYVCGQSTIGDTIRTIGGMCVILALVEASETRDMLHMSLSLLAAALHQNPHNVHDMQVCRGYHLLALFLHQKMMLFDMQLLEIFFQIAACQITFSESSKCKDNGTMSSTSKISDVVNDEDVPSPKYSDEFSSVGSDGDLEDFSIQKDSFIHFSELENDALPTGNSNVILLSNSDMLEHVLLDWTLWVTASVQIQNALLVFLDQLVSVHHNLTVLRQINIVQLLLVTLQRASVEVSVLEKLVHLLKSILQDGLLSSELENVVMFAIMTFDPPKIIQTHNIIREPMGKHVIVRNMLLEMLIDLQMSIDTEELLDQWHKIVSFKLINYFLDEAVHPTSMKLIMTLVGICIGSSPTFAVKVITSGDYRSLTNVLSSFYDSPEIYYILFSLIFGKAVYPRLPEVRMIDFHDLIPSDGTHIELKFEELLESIISMAKSTFDRLSFQSMIIHQTGNLSEDAVDLGMELIEEPMDMSGELQGEALMHKTYAARLMGGEASAPSAATSILRFMVDLAKMCPAFSAICQKPEILESCVDLYFSCIRAVSAVKLAKSLSVKNADGKITDDVDDKHSSQNTFSSLPRDQDDSVATSISIGSSPLAQRSSISDDLLTLQTFSLNEKSEKVSSLSHVESSKSPMEAWGQTIMNLDSESVEQSSTLTSSTNEFSFHNVNVTDDSNAMSESIKTKSIDHPDSPIADGEFSLKRPFNPSSSPLLSLTSWLGSPGHIESKSWSLYAPSVGSSNDFNSSQETASSFLCVGVSSKLLCQINDLGYGGGPCSAGAAAVLDLLAEIMAEFITQNVKAVQIIESILEIVPLYVDTDSVLVFQGLCLDRLMNFLERRLLRDDEEDEKKLDHSCWTVNLDAFSWLIVDRVYMGAFPQPSGVLRTLEFLLSMLQLINKDGRIEAAVPTGKGILSITGGMRQLDPYINSLLKNTNRMIMYCFLPSFLNTIGEENFLYSIGLQVEHRKVVSINPSQDSIIDVCTILQLIIAHKGLILCPSNLDTDLMCCLCVNLISLLRDKRHFVQNMAIDIIKYLLLYHRAALEELLVSKPNQGSYMDLIHGGFDKLLTESSLIFFEWFQASEHSVNKILEHCAAIMWFQYIAGSSKFPGVRIKALENRRKKEMGRKALDIARLHTKDLERVNEQRSVLELERNEMETNLRVFRQDKYGWILHAESEWQTHLQQLVHERGVFPRKNLSLHESEWQLCPIEGPYRMRKKLERCPLKISTIRCVVREQIELDKAETAKEKHEDGLGTSEIDSDSLLNTSTFVRQKLFDEGDYEKSFFPEEFDYKDCDSKDNVNEASYHSAHEFGAKSSVISGQLTESVNAISDIGSPSKKSSSMKTGDMKISDEKSDVDHPDNGEYLIRPYLEPLEKIKFRYNCERVVGLDKHDGIFLIGERGLYVIENFYIDDSFCIHEKNCEDEPSIIDQALGVKKDVIFNTEFQSKSSSPGASTKDEAGARAWAYNGSAWGKEEVFTSGTLHHPWYMWNLESVHEILKRDYQLRPVAIEIFSMDGCNELLVFHKREREEVFKNLVSMNLPRNGMLDITISGSSKLESYEGSRLFKITAKSFSKRWQNGEISNFQYLMHLNTLAGRGYNDLTQYPVFPWVLADYESETLDLTNPAVFRKLDKPMGCQTEDGEEEFKKRYESWDDPDVPKFHYGSHYSSAGIVLFYLVRLPPFSAENQKLQGGQFDHADRLFNSVRDTWTSASGRGNTSDVKELIPEFFYMPEYLENRFHLDLGEKQSGEKVYDVILPPWARGSATEFIRKHREALESDYVSDNLHHWIDLIFGYKQRGKAAEQAVNVFYHYTYEGSVDIDSISDLTMKASILAQINHFGQTPKQLFLKPHIKRRSDRKLPPHPLRYCNHLVPHENRRSYSFQVSQIVMFNEKILVAGSNNLLKPRSYDKYVAWGFSDCSLRFLTYDQNKLLSTHENLHGGNQIMCVGFSHDGQILVTGASDGVVSVWRISSDGTRAQQHLSLERSLCAHTSKVSCLHVSQSYMLIISGSEDCTVILWDLRNLVFVRQLPEFPAPLSAIHMNDLTGEIVTAAGVLLTVWSINGDCLAIVNTSHLPSDLVLTVTGSTYSDWLDTNWYVTGHQSGAIKVWHMVHCTDEAIGHNKSANNLVGSLGLNCKTPEYRLVLHKVLKVHKHPVTSVHLAGDHKQLLSGDSGGHIFSWTLPEDVFRGSYNRG